MSVAFSARYGARTRGFGRPVNVDVDSRMKKSEVIGLSSASRISVQVTLVSNFGVAIADDCHQPRRSISTEKITASTTLEGRAQTSQPCRLHAAASF